MMQLLKDNNVHVVIVPAACTDGVQSLDLNLNKSAEEFLREWYFKKIFQQLQQTKCSSPKPVDLK